MSVRLSVRAVLTKRRGRARRLGARLRTFSPNVQSLAQPSPNPVLTNSPGVYAEMWVAQAMVDPMNAIGDGLSAPCTGSPVDFENRDSSTSWRERVTYLAKRQVMGETGQALRNQDPGRGPRIRDHEVAVNDWPHVELEEHTGGFDSSDGADIPAGWRWHGSAWRGPASRSGRSGLTSRPVSRARS